jgi:GABA permease
MARHLVVGNQTLLSHALTDVLKQRSEADHGECHFHVVVPQTPLDHYLSPVKGPSYSFLPPDVGDVQTVAEHRLEVAMAEFSKLDAVVTGVVGDEKPLVAIRHALSIDDYDEVILSTFPEIASRWLRTGLVNRLEEELDIPITHVEAHSADEHADRRRYEELVQSLRSDD